MKEINLDAMFSGVIGQDYEVLKLICPASIDFSKLVGIEVGRVAMRPQAMIDVVELGGGTGITTLAMLSASDRLKILSVDNEPTMQNQAKEHLASWVSSGHLSFCSDDALTALKKLDSSSVDVVASAYTLHNFRYDYRQEVLHQIFRVLKPDGDFINGDRYALNDKDLHIRAIQKEVAQYFRVLTSMERLDLLENWIVHLFNDESENYLMRESKAHEEMVAVGFENIAFNSRYEVNAVCTAKKPLG